MKISMQEAAINLERICDEVENCEEIAPQLESLFHDAKDNMENSIARRIGFILYAQSQVRDAGLMIKKWESRRDKFDEIIDRIKEDTMETMKMHPNIPFSSELGSFRVQRNSVPSLELDKDFMIKNPQYYFETVETRLDGKRVKDELTEGKQIEGASLKYGEHLRISLRSGPQERL